jgi:uncharacterized membrane protein YciS (DUF1049 family)
MSCSSGCCCGSSSSGCPCDSLFEAVSSLAGIPASLYGGIASASGGSLSKFVLNIVLITLLIIVLELPFTVATATKEVFTFPLINIQDIWIVITVVVASVLAGAISGFLLVRGFWSRVQEFLGDPSTIEYYIKIAEDLKSRIDDCCSCCGCCSQLVRGWVNKVLEDTKSYLEDIKRRGLLEMIKKAR